MPRSFVGSWAGLPQKGHEDGRRASTEGRFRRTPNRSSSSSTEPHRVATMIIAFLDAAAMRMAKTHASPLFCFGIRLRGGHPTGPDSQGKGATFRQGSGFRREGKTRNGGDLKGRQKPGSTGGGTLEKRGSPHSNKITWKL